MLQHVQAECEDLRGCEIDLDQMLIKTKFGLDLDQSDRAWDKIDSASPAWWTTLANLPADKESLLIIKREAVNLVGDG